MMAIDVSSLFIYLVIVGFIGYAIIKNMFPPTR